MKFSFHNPYDPEFLGSGHHRIIEASAGTGKTHFIEEQVLFWILHGAHLKGSESPVVPEIHQVLVLTFTEKATGELKLRIRQRLADFVRQGISSLTSPLPSGASEPEMIQRADRALKRFDSACIFTIHGFCNHIIRTTGISGDADFKIEQNDLLREEAITETVRRHLLRWFGPRLALALTVAGFFDYKQRLNSEGFAFDTRLLSLLEHIREEGLPLDYSPTAELMETSEPLSGDLFGHLEPTPSPTAPFAEEADELPTELNQRVRELNQNLLNLEESVLFAASFLQAGLDRKWQENSGSESSFHQELFGARKQFNSRIKTVPPAWMEALEQLLNSLSEHPTPEPAVLWPLLKEAAESTVQKMGPAIDPSWDKVDSSLGLWLKSLVELWEGLQGQYRPLYEKFMELCSLQVDRITSSWKRTNRSLEFQDLLRFVDREVQKQPELPAILRERFPFAVIDEFQDTDPVQWSIFKNIYLVSNPKASITVVGDPKQSIYGFRGADISAYGMARQAIVQDGLEGRLAVSYRSSAPLLAAFNSMFSDERWFGDIYHPVEAAPDDKRKWTWSQNMAGSPVEVHDLKDAGNQTQRMFETGRIIASDISNLEGKWEILERGQSQPRALNYEDLAILVSRNKDARIIERVLRERSIPCSIYKEGGLYTSVPAYEFLVLLHSLQDLNRHYRQLRLTSYFPAPLVSVATLAEPGADHTVLKILDGLRELALSHRWPGFFRELLDSTFVLEKRESNHLYEARISVTLQLLEEFSEYAIGYACSLEELIQYVQRAAYGAEIQQDLMRRKRDKAGVSIMTIHASKGLQFPVVFSALQFTGKAGAPDLLRYQGKAGMKLSLSHDPDRVALHELERLNEDRRLAYVAFTRAALKLYVYFVSNANSIHPLQKEVMGPIFSDLQESRKMKELHFRNAPSAGIGQTKEIVSEKERAEEEFVFHQPDLRLSFEKSGIQSFSSLLGRIASPMESRSLQEKLEEMLSPFQAPTEPATDEIGESLPAGIDFGLMVHSILEDLDFDALEQVNSIIHRRAEQYFPDLARDSGFQAALLGLIQNTVQSRLPGCSVALNQVPASDRLAEMEFFLSSNPEEIAGLTGVDLSEFKGIYLRGFVDLIFRRENRYYLLDWKTNRLPSYGPEQLQKEMQHHRYDVQARIYFQAMRKWLAASIADFDPSTDLGGAYYLFVRGMKPETQNGILFLRPEELNV